MTNIGVSFKKEEGKIIQLNPCQNHDKASEIEEAKERIDKLKNRVFESGAQRDSSVDKIRPDLISPKMLKALGRVLADGAKYYGARNWEKGMPLDVFKESAARHYVSWMNNEQDEDHAAKLIFNIMGYIHFRD